MLAPKRILHRKVQRGSMKGQAKGNTELHFGEFGIQALEAHWITNRQIEAARIAMTRYMKRGGRVYITIFPDKPITKKPAETRMGSGKGNPEEWVAVVKPGRIMFEVKGVPEDYLEQLERLAAKPKVVAVGEIGLDYYWEENASPDVQKRFFEDQLLLAKRLCLPVIIHDREAHGDTMELLQKHKPKGVLHCFSGSIETARQAVKLGLYLGFGGSVTFKNARHPVEAAGAVPLDRLLLETDAPYMAPVPCRGKRNDSSLIRYVAEKIAEIRGISAEQVLNASFENARALFSI